MGAFGRMQSQMIHKENIAFVAHAAVFEQIKHSRGKKTRCGISFPLPPDITPLVLRVRSGHIFHFPCRNSDAGQSHTTHPPNLEGQPSHAWRKR